MMAVSSLLCLWQWQLSQQEQQRQFRVLRKFLIKFINDENENFPEFYDD